MPGPPKVWKAVTLTVPTGCEDELVGSVSRQILGLRVDSGGQGLSSVEMYVDSDDDLEALQECIAAALSRLGVDDACCRPTVRSIPDGRWVERYQETLLPFTIGDRFVVYPGDATPDPDGSRIPIILVPGRAFGTGEHATTRLCMSALETEVSPRSRWLDVGCGSGILSVAAALLGAAEVTALDIDPDAVDVCGEVAAANGVTAAVHVRTGSLDQVADAVFDGAVANIHAPFFLAHAPELHRALRPGGVLACTGFLKSDLPEIVPALEGAGFTVRVGRQDGAWALIVADAAP